MSEHKVLYDSFNARYLSFNEVAETFISNDFLYELLKNNHSLLMGPRGCGKTTLLKMLTPSALSYWDSKHKTDLFESAPFYAIYVPTDVQWKRQLDELVREFGNNDLVTTISKSTITINILISVVKTFASLIDIKRNNESNDFYDAEIDISKLLIDTWHLNKPMAPTFNSIKLELLSKMSFLNSEINKWRSKKEYQIELPDFFYFDYFDQVSVACECFSSVLPSTHSKKWALCFDELEIAPEWLQLELLDFLRSRGEQRILFKLTTAPIVALYKEINAEGTRINATENNDFKVIRVWTANQKDFKQWNEFAYQLVRSRISRLYESRTLPEDIFGESDFDLLLKQTLKSKNLKDRKNDYEKDSLTWNLMKELALIDNTFLRFLVAKDIDPFNPTPRDTKQKNEVFRKIKQLAIYRYQFLKNDNYRRSRKVIPLYYGLDLIFTFCDGNPRMLIGVIDEMLKASHSEGGEFRKLPINEQSRILTEASRRYLLVISSHPDANVTINNKNVNLRNIIEEIGDYFHSAMIDEPFKMDPHNLFKIDNDINNKLLHLLELALYLGSIVYLDSHDVVSRQGLLSKKFRLSYTLSPYFSLLSREYKEIELSTILQRVQKNKAQQTLFFKK